MELLKRAVALSAVASLLFVSSAALADENDGAVTVSDVTTSDVAVDDTAGVVATDDTTADDAAATGDGGDVAGDEGQSDSDTASDSAPNGAPFCPTLRDAESIDVKGTLVDYVATGTENFEFHSGIVEANDIDETVLLDAFMANGFVSYEEFVDFLKPFDDPAIDLSEVHGIQSVVVTYTQGGTCTGDDWHGSAALAARHYEFEVVFPTTSTPVYAMPLFFDDQELLGVSVTLAAGSDPKFDRLMELNGTQMRVDEFLTVLENDLGVSPAKLEIFPKVGEVYGKHTVKFADYENTWSIVTVVYPEKTSTAQPTPKPQTPATAQPSKSLTGNSTSSNNVVTPSAMSYIQFRGNSAPAFSPVGVSPIVSAPAPATGSVPAGDVAGENDKAEVGEKNEVAAPTLPVTGPDDKTAALVGDGLTASQAALVALAASVLLGLLAAISVILVRRFMKKR